MPKHKKTKFDSIAYRRDLSDPPQIDICIHDPRTLDALAELTKSFGDHTIVLNRNDVPVSYIAPNGKIYRLTRTPLNS